MVFLLWFWFLLIVVDFHIGHIHIAWILLIHKNISLHKFNALLVGADLNVEIPAQELEEVLPLDIRIQCIGLSSKDENRSEEVDEDCIHDRVIVDGLLYADASLS